MATTKMMTMKTGHAHAPDKRGSLANWKHCFGSKSNPYTRQTLEEPIANGHSILLHFALPLISMVDSSGWVASNERAIDGFACGLQRLRTGARWRTECEGWGHLQLELTTLSESIEQGLATEALLPLLPATLPKALTRTPAQQGLSLCWHARGPYVQPLVQCQRPTQTPEPCFALTVTWTETWIWIGLIGSKFPSCCLAPFEWSALSHGRKPYWRHHYPMQGWECLACHWMNPWLPLM